MRPKTTVTRLPSRIQRALAWISLVAVVVGLVMASSTPAEAAWWVETRTSRDDIRVDIDPSGMALVEHRITLHIAGGPLYEYEVRGVEPNLVLEDGAYIIPLADSEKNSLAQALAVSATVEAASQDDPDATTSLKLKLGDDKGVRRGTYVIVLKYKQNLRSDGITASGALATVRLRGFAWDDGLDAAKAVFVVPTSPTPPRVVTETVDLSDDGDTGEIPPTFLSTLRRNADRDELELVRPYAAKGEVVEWTFAVDNRVFPWLQPAATKTADRNNVGDALDQMSGQEHLPRGGILAAAFTLFLFMTLLVAAKSVEHKRLAIAAGATPRPVVPLPMVIRAPLCGLAVVVGVGLQLHLGSALPGSVAIASAALLAAHRPAKWNKRPLRGPGRWLPVTAHEAFVVENDGRGGFFDLDSRSGILVALTILAAMAGGVYYTSLSSVYHATLIALDGVVLIALFATGGQRDLPPDPAVSPGPLLLAISKRLTAILGDKVRITPRIRVPDGEPDPDELRLWISPKKPIRGFVGIEIGVSYAQGAGGTLVLPEVLLRYTVDTPSADAVGHLSTSGRTARGRTPQERVLGFSPRIPNAKMTATIAAALIARTFDRTEPKRTTPPPSAVRDKSTPVSKAA